MTHNLGDKLERELANTRPDLEGQPDLPIVGAIPPYNSPTERMRDDFDVPYDIHPITGAASYNRRSKQKIKKRPQGMGEPEKHMASAAEIYFS